MLLQLYELGALRAQVASYDEWIAKEKGLFEREKAAWQQAIDNEKKATELSQRETALAQEQARFYRDMYESVIKKRGGIGCTIAKILTIGIYRCK